MTNELKDTPGKERQPTAKEVYEMRRAAIYPVLDQIKEEIDWSNVKDIGRVLTNLWDIRDDLKRK